MKNRFIYNLILLMCFLFTSSGSLEDGLVFTGSGNPDIEPSGKVVFLFENANYGGDYMGFTIGTNVETLRGYFLGNSTSVTWDNKVSSIKVGEDAGIYLYKYDDFQGTRKGFSSNGSSILRIPDLSSYSFNDQASSLKVLKYPEVESLVGIATAMGEAEAYTNTGTATETGQAEAHAQAETLAHGSSGVVRNVIPKPGVKQVIIFEHDNFQGAYYVFEDGDNYPMLSLLEKANGGHWNDKISSVLLGQGVCITAWENKNYNQERGDCTYWSNSDGSEIREYPRLSRYDWNDKISSISVAWYKECKPCR